MNRWNKVLIAVGCLMLILNGCAGLAGDNKEKRVRTLGVLPILIDYESIDHSARDGLVDILRKGSKEVDDRIVAELREKGNYFDVRLIQEPAGQLYEALIASRQRIDDGDKTHHAYTLRPETILRLAEENLVDAVLVVVINGITRTEKRWKEGRFTIDYLEARYRSLLYSASVIAPPADQLWVREHRPGSVFLRLDYPDFTEAYWNNTDEVRIKEITLAGLDRTLAELEDGQNTPKIYNDMVRDLVGDLKRGL